MDELMKQAEDHLTKGRVQIATDEAILGIEHIEYALKEIEGCIWHFTSSPSSYKDSDARCKAHKAVADIRAALSSNAAQSAGQEPVAWLHEWHDGARKVEVISRHPDAPTHYAATTMPLYTRPSSAAQVSMSDEAIFSILLKHGIGWETGTGVMESLASDDESGSTFLAAIREVLAHAGSAQVEEIPPEFDDSKPASTSNEQGFRDGWNAYHNKLKERLALKFAAPSKGGQNG